MYVYLAGGLRTDWQDRVIAVRRDVQYFDPRYIQARPMSDIAATERRWIKECDLLFAYFESSNPSGIGLAAEIGYALALGKYVIYCHKKPDVSSARWLEEWAHFPTSDFDQALSHFIEYGR